jgi:protein TonB
LPAAAPGEYYPKPDEFVPVQSMPKLVKLAQPAYPEIAVLTRVEGELWVKVLVGRDGQVRDAIIVKESGTNVGFEKAALDAAYQNRYVPAIQNKKPVAVWATYKVVFKLADGQ